MTQPREVIVKRWRCAFCPRGYSVKKRAVEHMERCWHNPEVLARKVERIRAEPEWNGEEF